MRMKRIIVLSILLLAFFAMKAQEKKQKEQQEEQPKKEFISPIKFPMRLAATFAEIRTNHFHMGIDIRTQEVEGKNVYSIADGYISRIKISRSGYGKAIYITHTNGTTSVYGHLKKFRDDIQEYVTTRQYKEEKSEIQLFLGPSQFPLKQGDFFALSGNTGYSSGPHIHFEIRDTKTEAPINPLLFGYKVPDNTPPHIGGIRIYTKDKNSFIQGKNKDISYTVQKSGKTFKLKQKEPIKASGNLYFGINTFDPFNNWNNKNGVYFIKLFINEELIYFHKMDTISYDKNRYVNSLMDYETFSNIKRKYQKSYKEPGNFLNSIYKKVLNNGVYHFDTTGIYLIRYEVGDIEGNISKCEFSIQGSPSKSKTKDIKINANNSINVPYNKAKTIKLENFNITIPKYALYDNLNFEFNQKAAKKGMYSPIYSIHKKSTPLQKKCDVSFKIDSIPNKYKNKVAVVKLTKKGTDFYKSTLLGDRVSFRTNEFGDYSLMIDSIAPTVKALNFKKNKIVSSKTVLSFRIKDNLSNIASYKAYLNGKWILTEYNLRFKRINCSLDRFLKQGKNDFQLIVSDSFGNTTKFETMLIKK